MKNEEKIYTHINNAIESGFNCVYIDANIFDNDLIAKLKNDGYFISDEVPIGGINQIHYLRKIEWTQHFIQRYKPVKIGEIK